MLHLILNINIYLINRNVKTGLKLLIMDVNLREYYIGGLTGNA
jgi:hypothetical protein